MIDFSTLQGLTIPEGVVTQIADASGRVLWVVSGGKVVLEVEKITSDTYAGETTYTAEEFILLDIYPKTNGTVNVTYGGLTKTITDTSGAEEPNAQQVFFGTFNGVSDEVETPASGELVIEGDCVAFGASSFQTSSKMTAAYSCVTTIVNFGEVTFIPKNAFINLLEGSVSEKIESVIIPKSVKSIGEHAFYHCEGIRSLDLGNGVTSLGDRAFDSCTALTSVTIPASVESIGINPWISCHAINSISVDSGNAVYRIDGNCLIEIAANKIITGFEDSIIPSYVEIIADFAFGYCSGLTSVELLEGLTTINNGAFYECTSLISVTIPDSCVTIGDNAFYGCTSLTSATLRPNVTYGASVYYNCTGLTSVELQDGLTAIPKQAFYGCTGLTSAIVPASVTSIGESAFNFHPTDGFTLYVLATTPPTCSSNIVKSGIPIVVPKGCGEAYKAASGWSSHKKNITEEE